MGITHLDYFVVHVMNLVVLDTKKGAAVPM